jgi:hypothetical protein
MKATADKMNQGLKPIQVADVTKEDRNSVYKS